MPVAKINGGLNISGTNVNLKDLYDGTGVTLGGTINRVRIFRDGDAWIPDALRNQGASKVLGIVTPWSMGEFGIAEKGGQCYPYCDGHFYQNEGAYRCLDTSDLGNYHFYKYGVFYVNSDTPLVTHSFSIVSKGRPVFISVTGDINPINDGGGWMQIRLWKGSSVVASQIVQSISNSCNVPFCINYLDVTGAGQQNYAIDFALGTGNIQLGESGGQQAPQILAFEI